MGIAKRFIGFILEHVFEKGIADFVRPLIFTGTLLPKEVDDESDISVFAAIVSVGDFSLLKEAHMRLSELELSMVINLEDKRGKRPLDRAYLLPVENPDRDDIISFLLEEKATVGYAAINFFVSRGNLEAIRKICEQPAKFNVLNFEDKTHLMVAAEHDQLEVVKFFLEKKLVDPSIKNNEGETAFDLALMMGHENIADYLEKSAAKKF